VPVQYSGSISIDDPAAKDDILDAYESYWKVTADAFYLLDPTGLDAVAAGNTLQGLRESIDEDRAGGRALKTNVEIGPLVVRVNGDDAEIVDIYDDSSIWVDLMTKQPLPGAVAPASPHDAPTVSMLWQLHRFNGVWKVTNATQYTCQGSTASECASDRG
jgi:hypothetical protein